MSNPRRDLLAEPAGTPSAEVPSGGPESAVSPPIDPAAQAAEASDSILVQVFNAEHYASQIDASPTGDPAELLQHYLENGHLSLASPHVLFDAEFYVRDNPDLMESGVNPMDHYVHYGAREQRRFHPLFDLATYSRRTGLPLSANALLHYITTPSSDRADPTRVRALSDHLTASRHRGTSEDPFVDYLRTQMGTEADPFPRIGATVLACRTHPPLADVIEEFAALFDLDYYRDQLQHYFPDEHHELGESFADLVVHYLDRGAQLGLDPHPLFNGEFYFEKRPEAKAKNVNPLYDFIRNPTEAQFHPLFGTDLFRERWAEALGAEPPDAANALLAYVSIPPAERPNPSREFDDSAYREAYPDIPFDAVDPLTHYLATGYREGRWPSPAFDPACFARALGRDPALTPVRPPLVEYRMLPAHERPSALDLFDPDFYEGTHRDLPEVHAYTHFLRYGFAERRRINRVRSAQYVMEREPTRAFDDESPLRRYLLNRMAAAEQPTSGRVLFVGHEGTRTGAPLILLQLVRSFGAELGHECITILDRGGELEGDYERYSHVLIPAVTRDHVYQEGVPRADFANELRNVLERFGDDVPTVAFCNSLEIALYAQTLRSFGMTTVSLVHEVADGYHPTALRALDEGSDVIVCPSEFVAHRLKNAAPRCADRIVVEPQGLLRDNFGEVEWSTRPRVFAEQGIGDDDVVVLGCGTADGRKGIDLFAEVAARVGDRLGDDSTVWFVWLGSGFEHLEAHGEWEYGAYDRVKYWAEWDKQRTGASHRMRIIPATADVEAYFAASDIFALTSRADPFPCVVHEAMACRMPVIAFQDAGGAPEAIADTGRVVPYKDCPSFADAVVELATDGELRRELGEKARRRVKERYRFGEYAARMSQIGITAADRSPTVAPERALEQRRVQRVRRDVIFTAPAWSVSGVTTFTEHLIEHLEHAGHSPELVLANGRFFGLGSDTPPSIPYRFLQPRANTARARWEALERYFVENAPCVFVPNFDYMASALTPRLPSGVGILGIAHSDDVEHYEHVYRLGRYWNRIVAVSDRIAETIRELNPAFEPRLTRIPYGVPTPDPDELNTAIAERANSLEPLRIIYAGRLEQKQKRVLEYIEVAHRLAAAEIPFELTIVGEGSMKDRLEWDLAAFQGNGAVARVLDRASESEVAQLLRQSHVFLLLSSFEGLPVSLLEAMANGCVPIAPRLKSGVEELVVDGENGLLYPPLATADAVEVLGRLQTDPDHWGAMARAAAATVVEKEFTVDAMGARYAELIDEILSEVRNRTYSRPLPLTTIDPDGIAPAAFADTFRLP